MLSTEFLIILAISGSLVPWTAAGILPEEAKGAESREDTINEKTNVENKVLGSVVPETIAGISSKERKNDESKEDVIEDITKNKENLETSTTDLAKKDEQNPESSTPSSPGRSRRIEEGEDGAKKACSQGTGKLCWILALSRIAKVQSADRGDGDRGTKGRAHEARISVGAEKRAGSAPDVFESHEPVGIGSSKKEGERLRSRCRAIRDVYIPEIGAKLPAYACKLGNRTFVLSSARFLEDRRSRVDVEVDRGVFQEARIGAKASRSGRFDVVPALLVLKLGDEDYKVRLPENVSTTERRVEGDGSVVE
ncbi:hypothetical protein KM043_007482 [Ampulex compressa]|nr:hypothetical protein KM043_007482 [Ampulex compressa]